MADSTPLAHRLASFVQQVAVCEVPADQVRHLTRLLADTLACILAARSYTVLQLASYAGRHSSAEGPHATLLPMQGSGDLTLDHADVALAALANTAAARDLDANDLYMSASGGDGGHFSDAIPSILAAAEMTKATGAETLAAIAAAYEIQALLCDSARWTEQGWHTVGLISWAVPAAVARLMRLPVERAAMAMAIAGTTGHAFPTWLRPGKPVTRMKTVGPGLLAQRAIEAVDFAAFLVTSPDDALERMLAHLGADPSAAPVARLGREWTLSRNLIKRYPAQFLTQGAVQAALQLYEQGVRAGGAVEVRVVGHAGVCGGVQGSPRAFAPESREDADHSTPFVVATALLGGRLTPADYEGEPWEDPDLRAAMGRIRLIVEPERERARQEEGLIGCRVEAALHDGRTMAAEVRQPLGHPDAPMSDAGLLRKMRELVGDRAADDLPERLLAACDALPEAGSLEGLLEVVRPRA